MTRTRSKAGAAGSRGALVQGILDADREIMAVSLRLDGGMAGAPAPDLTMRQVLALYLLADGSKRVGELAKQLKVTLSSASGLVDRLVAAGFVDRRHGTADRRSVECILTSTGRKALEAVLQMGRSRLERLLSGMPVEDLRRVHEALNVLVNAARDSVAVQAGPSPR